MDYEELVRTLAFVTIVGLLVFIFFHAQHRNIEEKVKFLRQDMTRQDIVRLFGKPDDMGGTSRKYPTPSVYKYGRLEFYFEPWKAGRLVWVQRMPGKEKLWP